MTSSKVGKNYIYHLSYQLLTLFVPLLTTPYVSRVLGAARIGQYSYMLATVTYFSMFASLGVTIYGQILVAKNRDNQSALSKTVWELVVAKVTTSLICSIVYVLLGIVTQQEYIFFVFLMNILAVATDVSWVFQGVEEFQITVIRNFLVKIFSTLLIFLLVKSENDVALYVICIQGTLVAGNLTMWPALFKMVGKPKNLIRSEDITVHWKGSVFYFLSAIASTVYTVLDKSMIGILTKDIQQNGYYEQSHKIVSMLVMVVTSISMVMMPRSAYLFKEGDVQAIKKSVNESLSVVVMLGMPMACGIIAIAYLFVPLYLGDGYEPCVQFVQAFSGLIICIGLNNVVGKQILIASEEHKKYNTGVFCGAITNLVLNLLLIPYMKAMGAIIASVATEFGILVFFIYVSRKYISVRGLLINTIKYGMYSLLMGILVHTLSKHLDFPSIIEVMVLIVVGMLFYLLVLLCTKDALVNEYLKDHFRRNK